MQKVPHGGECRWFGRVYTGGRVPVSLLSGLSVRGSDTEEEGFVLVCRKVYHILAPPGGVSSAKQGQQQRRVERVNRKKTVLNYCFSFFGRNKPLGGALSSLIYRANSGSILPVTKYQRRERSARKQIQTSDFLPVHAKTP